MLDPEERQQLQRGMFVTKVIWGAFFSALAIYLVVCHLAGSESIDMGFDSYTLWIIKATLGVITCVSLVIAYFLRKSILKIRPAGLASSFIEQTLTSGTQPFPFKRHEAVTKYMRATIISTAHSESVGIYGLILFLLSGEFITLYAFIGVSALAFYYFRPRLEELEQLALDLKRLNNSV